MTADAAGAGERPDLRQRVRQAVIWRSGSQVVAQAVAWGSTLLVIRLLDPSDYGLFAMTQVVLVFLNVMNGYGLAGALIREEHVSDRQLAQVLGMLLLLNGTLATAQFALAPLAAAYYRQPMVAEMLQVQALLYFSTPFTALAHAVLSRRMDFKRPAQVRLVAAMAGAATALVCAIAGFGVWTLVAAPMVLFWIEAVGMTLAARTPIRPSFRFDGTWPLVRFGGVMMLNQLFWFLQSQADVFIAGRLLDPHRLGLYTTALFLTQILVSKFVPPLNDVAFAAYSRMGGDERDRGSAFLMTVRLILMVALPAYAGLAVVADPLVGTVLGEKWQEAAAPLPILSLAMAMLTLQILFAPATNALGRPGIALRATIGGSIIMPSAFLIGIGWGVTGLAYGWMGGTALLLVLTAALSMPVIGIRLRDLAEAAAPVALAALAMALIVLLTDWWLPAMGDAVRLALLAVMGIVAYGIILAVLAPERLAEAWQLVRYRSSPGPSPGPAPRPDPLEIG